MVAKYIAIYTGNGLFSGDVWQIYKHEPSLDNDKGLGYLNHTPSILYRTEQAAIKKVEELCLIL